MQEKIKSFVDNNYFKIFIIILIIINGIALGFETSPTIMENIGGFLAMFDSVVISIFTIEILLRIYAHRVSFFKDPWSIFDFIIVAISLIAANGPFEIFRVLRTLRLFRLITVIPQMRKIVVALLRVIPGMLSIAALLALLFYVSAIMATHLFGENFSQWFGSLGSSLYTLFQIMTLESWSMGIVRPVMEEYPYAWTFFIPFIFIVTFVMINLIVAIVVDAMNMLNKEEEEHIVEEIHTSEDHTNKELIKLQHEVKELKELILGMQKK